MSASYAEDILRRAGVPFVHVESQEIGSSPQGPDFIMLTRVYCATEEDAKVTRDWLTRVRLNPEIVVVCPHP